MKNSRTIRQSTTTQPTHRLQLIDEPLPGVKILLPFVFQDARGLFAKPYHIGQLEALGVHLEIQEEFFSISSRCVLRGMHFQVPPHAHQKLVYCIHGRVLDVLVDLRKNSPAFGKAAGFELSAANRHVVHIPAGFAHGFLSMEDGSCLVYKTDQVHMPESDRGIRWDTIGFDWPLTDDMTPEWSDRDLSHPSFQSFESPF